MSKSWIHWTTPEAVIDRLESLNSGVTLDPCSNDASRVPATVKLDGSAGRCGLSTRWYDIVEEHYGWVFVNPPYSTNGMRAWADKIAATHRLAPGLRIIVLTAIRPSAKWWQTLWEAGPSATLDWGPGRLSFDNPPPALAGKKTVSTVESRLWCFADHEGTGEFLSAFTTAGYVSFPSGG